MSGVYIGIDLGGTNLRIYRVNHNTGEINGEAIADRKVSGFKDNNELSNFILTSIRTVHDNILGIGCASAGIVDEQRRVVTNSSNIPFKGELTFARDLFALDYDVTITNDMRAAVSGIAKYGQGKGIENIIGATFSTGYNYSVMNSGQLTKKQIEDGHKAYRKEGGLFCGCGGNGHLEIYVSGNGAAAMAKQFFLSTRIRNHEILEEVIWSSVLKSVAKDEREDYMKTEDYRELCRSQISKLDKETNWMNCVLAISASDVYNAYKRNPGNNPQKSIQSIQSKAIADAFGMMVSSQNPIDLIVCMGSQTKNWDLIFEPALELFRNNPSEYHLGTIIQPQIVRNSVKKVGVVGAVAYHLATKI